MKRVDADDAPDEYLYECDHCAGQVTSGRSSAQLATVWARSRATRTTKAERRWHRDLWSSARDSSLHRSCSSMIVAQRPKIATAQSSRVALRRGTSVKRRRRFRWAEFLRCPEARPTDVMSFAQAGASSPVRGL